jgi:hypothetical protein
MKNASMIKGTLFLVAAVTLLAAMGAQAENGDFVWAKGMGGMDIDGGGGIAVDSTGNVYTTGLFWSTADFDPGPGTFNLTGGPSIFVLKIDSAGNFVWAKRLGGTSLFNSGYGITVDNVGNVYTTGSFGGTADFDPGAGTFNLSASGPSDIFVSKLDSAGNFVWAKRMGGSTGFSIAVDSAGNVYTTGSFNGTADFDPGAGTFNLTSAGEQDIFVSKLDSAGNALWAKSMGGTSGDVGYGIALDSAGNVYTTGYFSGTTDFDPGVGTFNLTSVGLGDIFVSKLDSAGNALWAKSMGGTNYDYGHGIAVDSAGNVYTTGRFQGTVDFDPGAGTFNLTSVFWEDIIVSKLDSAGNFVWAKSMGGTGTDHGRGIAVDIAGNVYTTGRFQGTADFDPGAGIFYLISAGLDDIFVSKLDSSGNTLWAKSMGGTSDDVGHGIAVDSAGNVYTTGDFQDTSDFDPRAGIFNLTSAGGPDIFLSKLSGPDVTPPTADVIAPTTPSPTNADTVIFDVQFSEDVQNFDAEADLTITETGTVAHTGVAITGGPSVYTVEITDVTGDGDLTLAVSTASDVEDLAGHPLDSSVTSAPVVIDNTPPEVIIISVAQTCLGGMNAEVTIDMLVSDNYGVNESATEIFLNGQSMFANTLRVGDTYTIANWDTTIHPDGFVTIEAYAEDLSGNSATDTDNSSLVIDNMPPTVTIDQQGSQADPTNTLPVTFDVVFSEEMWLDPPDAADIIQSGTATGVTFTVTNSGDYRNYTVQATALTGDGTVQPILPFNCCHSCMGNPNDASTSTDNSVTYDSQPPSADMITPTPSSPTNNTIVSFAVEFSEDVQGFDVEADLVITETGTVTHTGVTINGGPQNYTVDIAGISGDGDLALTVSTGSDVQDLAGNPLDSSVTSAAVAVDNTPPGISIGSPLPGQTTTGPVTYVVSYSGADVASLTESDITLDITGDVTAMVTVTPLGGSDWEVLLSDITGTGTLGFTIIPGTAVDEAGNFAPGASTLIQAQIVSQLPLAAWPVLLTLLAAGATALHRKRKRRT